MQNGTPKSGRFLVSKNIILYAIDLLKVIKMSLELQDSFFLPWSPNSFVEYSITNEYDLRGFVHLISL